MHHWDTNLETCVCTEDYYQIASATDVNPPVCQACPVGSTTNGNTNSDACSKYGRIILLLADVFFELPIYSMRIIVDTFYNAVKFYVSIVINSHLMITCFAQVKSV